MPNDNVCETLGVMPYWDFPFQMTAWCDTSGVEIDLWDEVVPEVCVKGAYMPLKPVFTDPRWY